MEPIWNEPIMRAADPFVLLHEGVYYLYKSADGFVDLPSEVTGISVYTSTDLVHWEDRGVCLSPADVQGDSRFWAPEVMERNGTFYMVYAADVRTGVAVSSSPLGPFCQEQKRWLLEDAAIDGHFFKDDDGKVYMYYARLGDGREEIRCAEMTEDCLSLKKDTDRLILRAETPEELDGEDDIAEGPFVLRHGGKYYLTYSSNGCGNPNYLVGCAVADSPYGPFVRTRNSPILRKNRRYNGPGHHCFTVDRDTGELICVFHTHKDLQNAYPRQMRLAPARFVQTDGGDVLCVDADA